MDIKFVGHYNVNALTIGIGFNFIGDRVFLLRNSKSVSYPTHFQVI